MESEPRTTVVGTVIDPVGTSELSGTDPAEGRGVGPGLSSIGPDGVVEKLAAKGYTVARVCTACAPAQTSPDGPASMAPVGGQR